MRAVGFVLVWLLAACQPKVAASPAQQPAPPAKSPKVDPAECVEKQPVDSVTGVGLPPEVIRSVIAPAHVRFRACYERALARDGSLEGKLQVSFVVGANGVIKTAHVIENTLPDCHAVACIESEVLSLRFPEAANDTAVVLPLKFVKKQ